MPGTRFNSSVDDPLIAAFSVLLDRIECSFWLFLISICVICVLSLPLGSRLILIYFTVSQFILSFIYSAYLQLKMAEGLYVPSISINQYERGQRVRSNPTQGLRFPVRGGTVQ